MNQIAFRLRIAGAVIAALVWIGSIFFLGSQLIGLGWILNVVTGLPKRTESPS